MSVCLSLKSINIPSGEDFKKGRKGREGEKRGGEKREREREGGERKQKKIAPVFTICYRSRPFVG